MRNLLLIVSITAAIAALPCYGQDAPKKDATPKPAVSPSQALLDTWNDVGRKLIAMSEDFPEDKYDFKPTPAQRSFAEQLLHQRELLRHQSGDGQEECPRKKIPSARTTRRKRQWWPS